MEYTGNYNLKKPDGTDVVNIEDLNDNADIIDQALKAHDDALATKETPQGAQEKADAALNSAKQYTDQEVGEVAQELAAHKADYVYQKAGGTATAITLTINNLKNGYPITFIASYNNNGNATTINGKRLYKPNTTEAPNLIKGKAYTIWYNSTNDCFFIKASAEGDASVEDVLAGKTFSNDNDTGLTGTMPNNGKISRTITTQGGQIVIPNGYHDGSGIVKAQFANLIASNIKKGINVGGVVGSLDGYRLKVITGKSLSPKQGTKLENIGFRPIQVFVFGLVDWFNSYDYNDYGYPKFVGGFAAGELLNQTIRYMKDDPYGDHAGELWANIRMINVTNDSCEIKTADYGGTSGKYTSGVYRVADTTIFILGRL